MRMKREKWVSKPRKRREMGGLERERESERELGKKSLMWVAWLSCAIVTKYRAKLCMLCVLLSLITKYVDGISYY